MTSLSQQMDLDHCSREADVAQNLMRWICGNHRLDTHHRDQLDFHYTGIRLPQKKVAIGCISYGADVAINIDYLGAYSISLPLHGRQTLKRRGESHRSDHHCGLIVSNIDQQDLLIEKDCKKLQVVIPEQSVQLVLSHLLAKPIDQPVIFNPQMPLDASNFLHLWWKNVQHCLDMRHEYARFDGLDLLSADYESFLIKSLLLTQENNYSAQLRQLSQYQLPKSVQRVKSFIHQFAHQDITAADLLMVSGVSRSTLYREFQEALQLSPMDYLKQYRLEQVRHTLQQAKEPVSVSRVATDWGFRHLGRFSQEYREAFGEHPKDTIYHSLS